LFLSCGQGIFRQSHRERPQKGQANPLGLAKGKNVEEPDKEGIYSMGVIAHIIRATPLEEGKLKILVQGIKRAHIKDYYKKEDHYWALVKAIDEKEINPEELSREDRAYISAVKELLDRAVALGKQVIRTS
jgi:ATP-dependent Lon protease